MLEEFEKGHHWRLVTGGVAALGIISAACWTAYDHFKKPPPPPAPAPNVNIYNIIPPTVPQSDPNAAGNSAGESPKASPPRAAVAAAPNGTPAVVDDPKKLWQLVPSHPALKPEAPSSTASLNTGPRAPFGPKKAGPGAVPKQGVAPCAAPYIIGGCTAVTTANQTARVTTDLRALEIGRVVLGNVNRSHQMVIPNARPEPDNTIDLTQGIDFELGAIMQGSVLSAIGTPQIRYIEVQSGSTGDRYSVGPAVDISKVQVSKLDCTVRPVISCAPVVDIESKAGDLPYSAAASRGLEKLDPEKRAVLADKVQITVEHY